MDHAPDCIAVGDDSGGRLLVLSEQGEARWLDMGAVGASDGEPLGVPFAAWVEAGLPLFEPETRETPSHVDLYLERAPEGGIALLAFLRDLLGLRLPSSELLALSKSPPARLQRAVPYGKALVLSRRINAREDCVGLRVVDHPEVVVPDPKR